MTYRLTDDAENDVLDIGLVTLEKFGLTQALKTHDALVEAFEMLGEDPLVGHIREDLTPAGKNLRYWTVLRRFLIVYRPDISPTEIIRVVDGARNVAALLGREQ